MKSIWLNGSKWACRLRVVGVRGSHQSLQLVVPIDHSIRWGQPQKCAQKTHTHTHAERSKEAERHTHKLKVKATKDIW